MSNSFRLRRGLESARTGITPALGELIYTLDEKKLYVGDGSTAGGLPISSEISAITGNVVTVKASVDLTTGGTQTIGTLPASADVIKTLLRVGTPSDEATTVGVGDSTNGSESYMDVDSNDPEISGTYISMNFVQNAAANRTIQATVTNPGTVGSATCIVEFRVE